MSVSTIVATSLILSVILTSMLSIVSVVATSIWVLLQTMIISQGSIVMWVWVGWLVSKMELRIWWWLRVGSMVWVWWMVVLRWVVWVWMGKMGWLWDELVLVGWIWVWVRVELVWVRW